MKQKMFAFLMVIALVAIVCTACGGGEKVVICGNCAAKLSESSQYCPSCGAQLFANNSNVTTAPTTAPTTEMPPTTQASMPPTTQSCTPPTTVPATTVPAQTMLPHSHSYAPTITKAATCTEKGYTTYACSCGSSYIANEVAPKGHSYTPKVTAPTCTMKGYTTYSCACGNTYTADEVAAKGHTWGNWTTVIVAEVGKAGQERRICSACAATETQEIPALQEDFTKIWFVTQFDIAKQQYVNVLGSSVAAKDAEIADLRNAKSDLYSNYLREVGRLKELYHNAAGVLERALRTAQQNYENSAKVYTEKIGKLEEEIAVINAEIANPNINNILAIVTENCNITSLETYEYYHRYSDSLA